jgi:hypothetical protein
LKCRMRLAVEMFSTVAASGLVCNSACSIYHKNCIACRITLVPHHTYLELLVLSVQVDLVQLPVEQDQHPLLSLALIPVPPSVQLSPHLVGMSYKRECMSVAC